MFLFTYQSLALLFYLEQVETKETTVKHDLRKRKILSQCTVKQQDFASPYNINNFEGIEKLLQRLTRVLQEAEYQAITVLYPKAMVSFYMKNLIL